MPCRHCAERRAPRLRGARQESGQPASPSGYGIETVVVAPAFTVTLFTVVQRIVW